MCIIDGLAAGGNEKGGRIARWIRGAPVEQVFTTPLDVETCIKRTRSLVGRDRDPLVILSGSALDDRPRASGFELNLWKIPPLQVVKISGRFSDRSGTTTIVTTAARSPFPVIVLTVLLTALLLMICSPLYLASDPSELSLHPAARILNLLLIGGSGITIAFVLIRFGMRRTVRRNVVARAMADAFDATELQKPDEPDPIARTDHAASFERSSPPVTGEAIDAGNVLSPRTFVTAHGVEECIALMTAGLHHGVRRSALSRHHVTGRVNWSGFDLHFQAGARYVCSASGWFAERPSGTEIVVHLDPLKSRSGFFLFMALPLGMMLMSVLLSNGSVGTVIILLVLFVVFCLTPVTLLLRRRRRTAQLALAQDPVGRYMSDVLNADELPAVTSSDRVLVSA